MAAYQEPDQIKLETVVYLIRSSGGSGRTVKSEKLEKRGTFNLRTGDWILMTFNVWKDIMSQSSYFKSQPDLVRLGEVGRGGPKILENASSGGIGMKLGAKNKQKS